MPLLPRLWQESDENRKRLLVYLMFEPGEKEFAQLKPLEYSATDLQEMTTEEVMALLFSCKSVSFSWS